MHELSGQYLDQVTAFLAVVDQGGFAAAARRVGRDASVLSKRVSALEDRLGIRLLERSTRSIALTEAGRRFASRMKAVLQAMEEAEEDARTQSGAPRGTLRLALPNSFGRMRIAPLLPDFLTRFPQVGLDVSYSDRYLDLVAENIDVAIRIGVLPDSSLRARKLADQKRLICAAPDYLDRMGHPQSPEDLSGHECFHFTTLSSYPHWRFHKGGTTKTVRVSGRLQADDALSMIHAALAGHGVIMCADWQVGEELAAGRLVQLLPDWQVEGEGAIYLIRPSNRFESGKINAFTHWITGQLASTPWLT